MHSCTTAIVSVSQSVPHMCMHASAVVQQWFSSGERTNERPVRRPSFLPCVVLCSDGLRAREWRASEQ